MRYLRYIRLATVFGVAAAVIGCESLGLSPPANPLMPVAKDIRNSAPVPAPVPRELAKELLPAFAVEPGDTLLVQPLEFDSPIRLPPDQPVFPDGTIDLGIYGRPVVAGKTLAEIEPLVQSLINAKEKDRGNKPGVVTARIIGRVSKVYYVLGEVNGPQAFPVSGRETVLDGIMAAGGLTKRADPNNIILSRPTLPDGCRVVYPVCYNAIVQLGDTATNYQIMPGDRIFVPTKGLLDNLLPRRLNNKRSCNACNRPEFGCFGGACGDGAPAHPGGPLPAIPTAPQGLAAPAASATAVPSTPSGVLPVPVPGLP